ncbi:preprotein translocase subunit YajC [Nocardioides sp.]|uniref:preprotein translocase subunit YajC n=1 Tax=Nocardioides sp. TaxID=35761 RepID=UPI003562E3B5
MPELVSLLPLVGIALLFWVLIIRPASKRQKELARMQSALSTGDQVMLTSGVYGVLREAADDHVMVEVAPGVSIKVARGAIGSVVASSSLPGEPEEN